MTTQTRAQERAEAREALRETLALKFADEFPHMPETKIEALVKLAEGDNNFWSATAHSSLIDDICKRVIESPIGTAILRYHGEGGRFDRMVAGYI